MRFYVESNSFVSMKLYYILHLWLHDTGNKKNYIYICSYNRKTVMSIDYHTLLKNYHPQ